MLPWHVFGPVTASAAENAAVAGQSRVTVAIARQLGVGSMRRAHQFSPSHRLDVAHAYASLRLYPEAVSVLQELRRVRPERLPQHRYARDILGTVITRRRTLTSEMRGEPPAGACALGPAPSGVRRGGAGVVVEMAQVARRGELSWSGGLSC
jgi:hypothetical protein